MLMPSTPPSGHQFATASSPSRAFHHFFFDPNAGRYLCCCGLMHVEFGVLLVALASLVNNVLYLLGYALSDAFEHQVWWAHGVMVPLSVLLAVAQCARAPRLYLIFLVGNAVNMAVKVMFLFLLLTFIAVFEPVHQHPTGNSSSTSQLTQMPSSSNSSLIDEWKSHLVLVVTILYVFDIVLSLWFEWIAYYAYRFVHTWQWNEEMKKQPGKRKI